MITQTFGCGCRVGVRMNPGGPPYVALTHCPLHEAAPHLAEMVAKLAGEAVGGGVADATVREAMGLLNHCVRKGE